MQNHYDIAIIGGDLRQVYMANLLLEKGAKVIVYGLCSEILSDSICKASSLLDAVQKSDTILGPIPLSRDQIHINSTEPHEDLTIEHLFETLTSKHVFIAGDMSQRITKYLNENKIELHDFMKMNEVSILNSISTAEGTILEAVKNSTINLHGSKCLILGFGKCAKILASKLKGLDASITIAARKNEDRYLAKAYGYSALAITDLKSEIHEYDFIFNTVPALLLDYNLLTLVNKSVTIIDIASAPGGVNYGAANELNINAKLCLGLPGKYAPRTSAKILVDVITHFNREEFSSNQSHD
ncbi:dipicolinate synthase subunit DpsA [Anaeromicropila herbilytica]|uniref:Dipicolinate synthase subunit A n=1 Tax=Anaeromicropila herbilytica TaxID=2785025 RepID=A0A7R7EKR8_9FIRM|nr:dipicolinate synthase subunit DpsA [Anaeromicropila herbilytica]BCN30597.1 dipicolinate synthase subunit A [Anaeromicropila herbilytica]